MAAFVCASVLPSASVKVILVAGARVISSVSAQVGSNKRAPNCDLQRDYILEVSRIGWQIAGDDYYMHPQPHRPGL